MNAPANHSALALKAESSNAVMGFGNAGSFALMQRAATLLANSTLVPAQYRAMVEKKGEGGALQWVENPNAVSNCVVALNMSQRMGADPLMVMQNLYIVEGRPSWSSQWIIAAINGCGRFSPLRFDFEDLGEKEVEYTTTVWETGANGRRQPNDKVNKVKVRNLQCIAWATEKATGERIDSPRVTMDMAVQEGWFGRKGSKWQTMPEIMLRYRTASFFGKLYAPELLMGIQSEEETHDILNLNSDGSVDLPGKPIVTMPVARTEAPAAASQPTSPTGPVDQATGEVSEPTTAAAVIQPADNPEAGAAQPTAAAAAPAEQKPARAASEPGAMATDGERKFVLNRAKSAGLEMAQLMEQSGLTGLAADLAGLTKDGFLALRDLLPKSV